MIKIGKEKYIDSFPVRQDVEILPADEPKKLKLGWTVSEVIGLGIVNMRVVRNTRKFIVDLIKKEK